MLPGLYAPLITAEDRPSAESILHIVEAFVYLLSESLRDIRKVHLYCSS